MKKSLVNKIILGLIISSNFILEGTVVHAEDQPQFMLDEIVVTATRTPVREFDANANISVIDKKIIEDSHFKDLTEALQTVPGVTVTRYGGGIGYEQSEGILINGSAKILVLIDGMRANVDGSEFSVFAFGAFKNLDNVERIEILKGSASTLYGSDAKGGVINIITKKATDKNSTIIGSKVGSYSMEQYRIMNQGNSGKYSYIVSAQKDKSSSYTDAHDLKVPAHMDATTLNFKINGQFDEKSDLTMSFDKYNADYMYSGTNMGLTERHYGTADNYNWRANYNYKFNDSVTNQLNIYNNTSNTNYDGWKMDLQTIGFSEQVTAKLSDKHELIGGVEYYENKTKEYLDQMNTKYAGTSLNNKAFFVQDKWNITDKFNLTGGLRYTNHSKAGNNTALSAVAGYDISDKTNVYISAKEYFIAPTQYQYFSPFGNENLKPESGYTYEAGINHKFDNTFAIQLHAFRRESKDVMAFAYGFPITPSNPYGGRYVNVDEETSNGWDVQLRKSFNKNFSSFVGYTHIEVKSQPAGGQESLNRYIPKGEWHVGLNYTDDKFDASLLGHGVIDRPGDGGKNGDAFPCDKYWVWDLSANYKFKKNAKVYAKVNNLFNKFYAEHSNVQWGNPDEWYTSPGRNFQVGIEYSF